jgi:hypothetical protein
LGGALTRAISPENAILCACGSAVTQILTMSGHADTGCPLATATFCTYVDYSNNRLMPNRRSDNFRVSLPFPCRAFNSTEESRARF